MELILFIARKNYETTCLVSRDIILNIFKKRGLRFDHGQPLDINNYHIWHNCVTFFYEEEKERAHLLVILDDL